jgi:hypothetical protein
MLSKKDIMALYYDGVELKFRRKKHPRGLKGDHDPSASEINIYTANIVSEYERDITILHEFIHARNDRKDFFDENDEGCEKVEREAKQTYRNRPYVLGLIKELYKF